MQDWEEPIPQALQEQLLIGGLELDEFTVLGMSLFLLSLTLIKPAISLWFFIYWMRKYKKIAPYGHFYHLMYAAGLMRLKGYPDVEIIEFRE